MYSDQVGLGQKKKRKKVEAENEEKKGRTERLHAWCTGDQNGSSEVTAHGTYGEGRFPICSPALFSFVIL